MPTLKWRVDVEWSVLHPADPPIAHERAVKILDIAHCSLVDLRAGVTFLALSSASTDQLPAMLRAIMHFRTIIAKVSHK